MPRRSRLTDEHAHAEINNWTHSTRLRRDSPLRALSFRGSDAKRYRGVRDHASCVVVARVAQELNPCVWCGRRLRARAYHDHGHGISLERALQVRQEAGWRCSDAGAARNDAFTPAQTDDRFHLSRVPELAIESATNPGYGPSSDGRAKVWTGHSS